MTRSWLIPVVMLVLAVALPFAVPTYYVQFVSKALIMGILAMALNLAVGHGGMVSLCHAAFFGLAGYVLALMSPGYDPASLLLTLPVAVLASAAAALVIGALALRTRGVYFIMVTLAFGEMLFFLFHDTGIAGGSDGAYVNAKPELAIAGRQLLDLGSPLVFYFVVLAFLLGVVTLLTMLVQSPFGHALAAAQFGFVAPQMLGWHLSATVLVMVLIGGLRSVTGPLLGALVLIGLEEVLKAHLDNWKLAEGLIIIAIVVLLPHGVKQIWPMIFGPPAGDGEVKPVNAEASHV